MREIIFRGKRMDNGEWVEGSLLVSGEAHRALEREDLPFSNSYIFPKVDREIVIGFLTETVRLSLDPYHVLPYTVGQYTGLKDKNGKRVFEGDILRVVSYTFDYDFRTSVGERYGYTSGLYVDGEFEDDGDFDEIGLAFHYWAQDDAEVEVVGNIHDNPEMMVPPCSE